MIPIIFFSHTHARCGVYQFGKQVCDALCASTRYRFFYCEVTSSTELREAVAKFKPHAVLANWHPVTLGWAEGWPLWSLQVPIVGIMHEMSEEAANIADNTLLDYYMLHDPSAKLTNPIVFSTVRLIQPFAGALPPPSRVTIGSIGFGGRWKNFEGLVARANAEFDIA